MNLFVLNMRIKSHSNITEPPLTQHIQTSDSGNGDWFQSTGIRITGSNQLVFGAKGSRDAVLGLAIENK